MTEHECDRLVMYLHVIDGDTSEHENVCSVSRKQDGDLHVMPYRGRIVHDELEPLNDDKSMLFEVCACEKCVTEHGGACVFVRTAAGLSMDALHEGEEASVNV